MYQVERIRQLVVKSFENLALLPLPTFSVQTLTDGRFVVDISVSSDVSESRVAIQREVYRTIRAEGYPVLVSCDFETEKGDPAGGKVFTEKDVQENYVPRTAYNDLQERTHCLDLRVRAVKQLLRLDDFAVLAQVDAGKRLAKAEEAGRKECRDAIEQAISNALTWETDCQRIDVLLKALRQI